MVLDRPHSLGRIATRVMGFDGLTRPASLLADHLVERHGGIREGNSSYADADAVVESGEVLAGRFSPHGFHWTAILLCRAAGMGEESTGRVAGREIRSSRGLP